MNITTYQSLAGITVASADTARVTAQINRTKAMLETMLGFPLCSNNVQLNLYNELGKTRSECSRPDVDTAELDAADEVNGNYRLFDYDENDKYFHIDPFSTVYKVKLAFIGQGSGDQGVTLKTFEDDELRIHVGREGWSKYIEHCVDFFCSYSCRNQVQLAIDADWLWPTAKGIPYDLQYVWAEMITHYSDPKRNIRSESVTTHSYSKFNNIPPEMEPTNVAIIRRYAGPHGSLNTASVA